MTRLFLVVLVGLFVCFAAASGTGGAGEATSEMTGSGFSATVEQAFTELEIAPVECSGPSGGNINLCGLAELETDALLAALDGSEAFAAFEATDEWHEDHGMYLRNFTWEGSQVVMIHNPTLPSYNLQVVGVGVDE